MKHKHRNKAQTAQCDCTSTLSKKVKLNAQVYVETYIKAEPVTSFERLCRSHAGDSLGPRSTQHVS